MNVARNISIACIAVALSACAAAPSKTVAPTVSPVPVASAVTDISGKWALTVKAPTGAVDATLTVKQTGSIIDGTLDSAMGVVDCAGTINGKELKFSYSVEQFGAPAGTIFTYVGTVDGAVIKGKALFANFGEGEWSAKRQ